MPLEEGAPGTRSGLAGQLDGGFNAGERDERAWLTARTVSGLSVANSDTRRVCAFAAAASRAGGRPGSVLIYVPVRIFSPPRLSTVTIMA